MNSHIDTTTGSKVVQDRLLLAINPGSTSTKLSIFNNQNEILETSIEHSSDDLKPFKTIAAQTELRLSLIRKFLLNNHVDVSELSAVAGRGGLLKPVESGVYSVNQGMLDDLVSAQYGEHASNLGAILAHRIAQECGCSAYIIDPVVVDEMEEVAKFSGMPEITRKSIFHALNQKSAAREVAAL